jgi:hypothetical protein
VTVNSTFIFAVIGGGLLGLGVFLVIVQLLPAAPALGPALDRLHPGTPRVGPMTVGGKLKRQVTVPHADLAILARSTDSYYTGLAVAAIVGFLLPGLAAAFLLLLGLGVPLYLPAAVSIVFAVVTMYATHREVLGKAAAARAEFRRAMCTYMGLAASQVLDGHGPMESLERSAAICHGWVFTRIRGALLRAQLMLSPPWDELKSLSREINVIELGDLADIMRTAGSEGANVAETIRARADSLRDQIRAEALSAAEVRTSKLDIPASALILVLILLIGYPFIARLFEY